MRRVWLAVSNISARYVILTEDGTEIPDAAMGDIVARSQIAIRKFFWERGLITTPQFDDAGAFIDGELLDQISQQMASR